MQLQQDERNLLVKILTYYQHYQCSIHSREYQEILTLIDKIVMDAFKDVNARSFDCNCNSNSVGSSCID